MLRRQNSELKEIRGSLLSIHCAIKKCAWLAEEARSHLRGRGGADHRFWSCISASKAGSLSSFSGKASSTILAFLAPFTICLERARLQIRNRTEKGVLLSSFQALGFELQQISKIISRTPRRWHVLRHTATRSSSKTSRSALRRHRRNEAHLQRPARTGTR